MRDLGTAQVIQGDARHLPLEDNSVDLVVTSPPYFALRSYQDGGEHYAGQLGSEGTPAEFVAALIEVTAECVRVLKPSGSLWVNLGDKYAGSGMGGNTSLANSTNYLEQRAKGYHPEWNTAASDTTTEPGSNATTNAPARRAKSKDLAGVRSKSLIGIPWRYALACIDDLGLILRAEVIWAKPNGLPESVTDRVRRSHEQWFHFTLEPRYFSAVDEIRETYTSPPARAQKSKATTNGAHRNPTTLLEHDLEHNPLGKLPGSVWTIPTQPLQIPDHLGVDHFAAYPTEWPRRIIQGWSPTGVCVECGEGRRPVVVRSEAYAALRKSAGDWNAPLRAQEGRYDGSGNRRVGGTGPISAEVSINGYACACPQPTADTRPAVILDPFGGTGTTALVAKALGRHGITIDMSADYSRLAEWRTNDRNQLAHVLGIAKAPTPDEHQDDLLTLLDGP